MKLTINEVAECLDVPLDTVERWIRQGRIPLRKSGEGCFFHKNMLEVWAKSHNLPFTLRREPEPALREEKPASLAEAMSLGGVYHGVKGSNAAEILESAVKNIAFLDGDSLTELYAKLMEREEMMSTGIGKGVAIPHPRTPMDDTMEEPVIVTCFAERPVDYKAIDDLPVFVLFVLLSPTVKIHLHLLSRLAYCVRDDSFVAFLRRGPGAEELIAKVESIEKRL
jgi:nitrogen PTS system EIIA component